MDWLTQAHELKQRGEIGRAIELLEQAIAVGEETAEICKETARLCLLVQEVRAFSNYCHEAMRIDPSDAEPHLMLARYLTAKRRWQEAVETLEHALHMSRLTGESRAEAERMLSAARSELDSWKQANPASNL